MGDYSSGWGISPVESGHRGRQVHSKLHLDLLQPAKNMALQRSTSWVPGCTEIVAHPRQRPVKTDMGCNFSTGRALSAAATMLTTSTITTPSNGVNHMNRKG